MYYCIKRVLRPHPLGCGRHDSISFSSTSLVCDRYHITRIGDIPTYLSYTHTEVFSFRLQHLNMIIKDAIKYISPFDQRKKVSRTDRLLSVGGETLDIMYT